MQSLRDLEIAKFTDGALNNTSVRVSNSLLTVRISYDVNGNVEYIGESAIGAGEGDLLWSIRKHTYDGSQNLLSVLFNKPVRIGEVSFTVDWTNRATHIYS